MSASSSLIRNLRISTFKYDFQGHKLFYSKVLWKIPSTRRIKMTMANGKFFEIGYKKHRVGIQYPLEKKGRRV